MADEKEVVQPIIIVRRVHGDHDDHHGGVWKVAFADFMTAMMAFFLVLWIVNSTSKQTRSSIARYFNPLQLSNTTPARKGLMDAEESSFDAAKKAGNGENDGVTKKDKEASGKEKGKKEKKDKVKDTKDTKRKDVKKELLGKNKIASKGEGKKADNKGASVSEKTMKKELRLRRLAVGPGAAAKSSESGKVWDEASKMSQNTEGRRRYRDPFEPLRPTVTRRVSVADGSSIGSKRPAQESLWGNAGNEAPKVQKGKVSPKGINPTSLSKLKNIDTGNAAGNDIGLGETNLTRSVAGRKTEFSRADMKTKDGEKRISSSKDGRGRLGSAGFRKIAQLIEKIDANRRGPRVEVLIVKDGILLSLMDRNNVSMFRLGGVKLTRSARLAVRKLAAGLKTLPNKFVIQGHTDSRRYKKSKFGNWVLSSARASETLKVLRHAGVSTQRLVRIEGHADRQLRNTQNRYAPENRRIDILLKP